MLGRYKKTREDIVKLIKKCQITEDGYYVCKNFPKLNSALGDKKDKKYTYDRYYFENKICFNQSDIEIYLEVNQNYYDIDRMRKRDNYIYNIIKNDLEIIDDIYKILPGYPFNLAEVIDTSIFIFYSKY